MWLLDTQINAQERAKRCLAFRYEGLEQMRKFSKAATKSEINPGTIRQRIGIGQEMPSTTDIVIKMLNKEQDYRLLSGMVHAHPWALQLYGFTQTHSNQMIFNNVGGAYFEKHLSFESIFFLCTNCVTCLFQGLLMNFKLFGWDAKPLARAANNAIRKVQPPADDNQNAMNQTTQV